MNPAMPASCCVKGCKELASIRQPLKRGVDLVLHIPLCRAHGALWESFASRLREAQQRSARERRDAGWLLDAALALAVLPPNKPL
jgi:hypothetical protein